MSQRTLTDQALSHSGDEYDWTISGHPESHDYLLAPVTALLEQHDAIQVLDLGCGNGALCGTLAERNFAMTGLDHSRSGVELARRNFPAASFEQHDLTQPLPAQHASAVAALRPGGLLVLSTPFHGYIKNLALALTNSFDAHWHPLRDFGHVKFFSQPTLRQLLAEAGMTRLHFSMAGRFYPLSKSMIVAGVKPE
jgi:SAM-dependent methyltransferase